MKIIKRLLLGGILLFFIVVGNSLFINYLSEPYLSSETLGSTKHTIGILFGTSKTNNLGTRNIFFMDRIRRAVELYHLGKIQYLLVSGDNSTPGYDETTDMRDFLVARGIPSDHIVLDYAGLSTRDSIARAKKIFHVTDLLLISQKFQVQRAMMACFYRDISCHGSTTSDIPFRIAPRVYLREYGARIKLRYDMLTPQPSIGGKTESTPRHS